MYTVCKCVCVESICVICFLVLQKQGDVLLKKKHPESDDVRKSLQRLNSKWNELLQASNNRGKGLVELKDILMFNEQVDKVEMWMREKVSTHEVAFVKSKF